MNDATPVDDRRAALDDRQAFIGALLTKSGADQLLLTDWANIHWFCAAPITRGIVDPNERPTVFVSATHRTIVCSNVDSQRIFDVYLDDLGFQLKEWPWHRGRDQLLADLCASHPYASDRSIDGAIYLGDEFDRARRQLNAVAQEDLRRLAQDLAHAIEATARTMEKGLTEREAAGQLGHRMLHRGVEPVHLHVAADGRLNRDLRPGFGAAPITQMATLIAMGHRNGLHASAARTVCFGEPFDLPDFANASQIAVARIAMMTPGVTVHDVLTASQRTAKAAGHENAWHDCPAGHFIGWKPVELPLFPDSQQPIAPGHAIASQSRINAYLCLDTVLMTDSGPELLTKPEDWPLRRYQLGEKIVSLPDMLRR